MSALPRRVPPSTSGCSPACADSSKADPTAHALAALDLRLGIVEGFWTQRAVEQCSWVVTQMTPTPQKAEELFERVGNMEPSKSSLDRAGATTTSSSR